METLKFSKAWSNAAFYNMFNASAGTLFLNTSGGSMLRMYSGTPLSVSQLNALTMSTNGSKASDVDALAVANGGQLLWVGNYYGLGAPTPVNNTVKTPDSPYATAVASGTATWFLVFSSLQITSTTNPAASSIFVRNSFMGTVSNTAGTGDLRLTDNNIVSGNTYRVASFTLSLPYETTF